MHPAPIRLARMQVASVRAIPFASRARNSGVPHRVVGAAQRLLRRGSSDETCCWPGAKGAGSSARALLKSGASSGARVVHLALNAARVALGNADDICVARGMLQGTWHHSSGGNISIHANATGKSLTINHPRPGTVAMKTVAFYDDTTFCLVGFTGTLTGLTIAWSNGVSCIKKKGARRPTLSQQLASQGVMATARVF